MRRIGIVALAGKLLIAFWKYLEKGIVPEGAQLKRPAQCVAAGREANAVNSKARVAKKKAKRRA